MEARGCLTEVAGRFGRNMHHETGSIAVAVDAARHWWALGGIQLGPGRASNTHMALLHHSQLPGGVLGGIQFGQRTPESHGTG